MSSHSRLPLLPLPGGEAGMRLPPLTRAQREAMAANTRRLREEDARYEREWQERQAQWQ